MEQLLEEFDSLQQQDLANLTGNWCESCESLRQEVKRLQDDQVQNFAKLKQKIIPTDLLIKKYKSKCDDYDNQTKRLEETTRRLEKAQRQSETLELQLKSSLLETEPLRKTKLSIEAELRLKIAELEDVNNKMVCAQGLQQQMQGENKYLTEQMEKLEEEKTALKEKLNWYKRTERDEDTIRHLKAEIASLKREIARLNKENSKLLKKENALETKLQDSNEKINHYCSMLKQRKLMTAAKKSLSHFRSPGKSVVASDSDTSFEEKDSFLHDDVKQLAEESGSSDDDIDALLQPSWLFNPMVKCLSPLPPSPACFTSKQTAATEADEDDDEYLSDLAEELESQLMDILSEDEIIEVGTENQDSQNTENVEDKNELANTHVDEDDHLKNIGAKDIEESFENTCEFTVTEKDSEEGTSIENVKESVKKDKKLELNSSENTCNADEASINNDEMCQNPDDSDTICKDVVDHIVNKISDNSENKRQISMDTGIEQTMYCDDTVLAQRQKLKLDSSHTMLKEHEVNETFTTEDTISDELGLSNEVRSPNNETFKSPKSLKERLKDSACIISPVSARQSRSSNKSFNNSDLQITCASGNNVTDERLDTQSENTCEQNANLNRSDTGEFTPLLNETESPSPISKEKGHFFISDKENAGIASDENSNSDEHDTKANKNAKTNNCAKFDDVFTGSLEKTGLSQNFKPLLKRQRALSRTDSSLDAITEKNECVDIKAKNPSTVSGTRNKKMARSKSLPNKWINFQKGSCETLAEEIIKFDVSKGGYECGENTHSNASDSLQGASDNELPSHKGGLDNTNSHLNETEDNGKKNVNNKSLSPIARRTRRSSRLLNLSENSQEQSNNSKQFSSNKNKVKVSDKDLETETAHEIVADKVLEKHEVAYLESNSRSHRMSSEDIKIETDKTEKSTKNKDKYIVPDIDFKGDSNKSCLKSIKDTADMDMDTKDGVHLASPNIEEISSKTTPSRQLSTGFTIHPHAKSDSKNICPSPTRLKESIIEGNESETLTEVASTEIPSVIFDIDDILSGNDNANNGTVKIRELSQQTISKDKRTLKPLSGSERLAFVDANEESAEPSNTKTAKHILLTLSEDTSNASVMSDRLLKTVSSNSETTGRNSSNKSSPVTWLDSASTASKCTESRSGSSSPYDSSLTDTPVLSPLPVSPFELVNLLSPLPPSPLPSSRPLSPLSECSEEDTESMDVTKSPERTQKSENQLEFRTPETKPVVDKEKLQFTPVPTMLSPIYTPKKQLATDSKSVVKADGTVVSQKPCKFISDVPKGVLNVKPKPNVSDNIETSKVAQDLGDKGLDSDVAIKSSRLSVESSLAAKESISEPQARTGVALQISAKSHILNAAIDSKVVKPVNQGLVPSQDNKADSKQAIVGGYDNLVASKTKARQAHQPKQPRLPVKKPVPIIEAPVLPVSRKRKSLEQEKDTEEKKPCKEQVFKRRQKSDSKAKSVDNKLMQSFLQSADPPEVIIGKFDADAKPEPTDHRIVTTCLECLSRIRNDTLDAVYESCTTDDYLNIIDDWPYLFPVEKQAIELCWQIAHRDKQMMTRSHVMEELWKRIFDNDHNTSISGKKSLCRLFTALCFKAGTIEEVRVLFYHIVVCGYMNVTSFLIPVISVWPEVLRREDDEDHGLVMVLEYNIMQQLKTQDNEAAKKIKGCAMKLCNWVEKREPADVILVKLLKKLQDVTSDEAKMSQVFELRKSIELLSQKEGWIWFYQKFVCQHCLQTVSNKWAAKGRNCELPSNYVCSVLKITGTVMCHFTGGKHFNDVVRHWILPILRKEPSCRQVRECCIETLLELSCFIPKILNNLQGWYYMYKGVLRADLELKMETLRRELVAKFAGVLCDPFIRKFPPTASQ